MKISFNAPVYSADQKEQKSKDLFDLELEIKESEIPKGNGLRTTVGCNTIGCTNGCATRRCNC